MLYSIIPPILVVMSLIGIIIILIKKAPAVAHLEDSQNLFSEEEKNNRELSARYAALKRENRKSFKDVASSIIGKTGGVFKGMASRFFGSGSSAWGKISDKARARIENKQFSKDNFRRGNAHEDFFQRKYNNQVQITDEEEYSPAALLEEAVKERSKEEVGKKEFRLEKKDLFEKILIDRIASNPKDIEAYERLGEYYLEIENWNYAKECFKQVIKLNPRNIGARSRMRKLEKILSK